MSTLNVTLPGAPARVDRLTAIDIERRHAEAIIDEVCRQFEITRQQLLSRRRPDFIAFPRQVAMALAYECTALDSIRVARLFQRTHGAVLHAMKAVDARIAVSAIAAKQVQACRKALESERP